ncbi:phosphoglycerate mutase (2,3-diphosphoglycerate-independent) [Candidatus Woesearchaeota archaeon CG10_big_fil_rev_8_21_14_0_10_37_12]|nr:MAG: phosphoglycerate mutase (2,3-diphosphoglycerate-independent) [Candidatus Woesearchaeota archaeon CG10_big_fil_rev_8_21_14_0_10_37_12]
MKTILVVLDGWGITKNSPGNAISQAKKPNWDNILHNNPNCTIHAAETYVGLLPGFIGNSEVGHLHLGSGRLVEQDLMRIHKSIDDDSFYKNKVLLQAMKRAKNRTLHLLGLLSDAGVHAHTKHLYALIDMAKKHNVKHIAVHAILDGRDVPPKSAATYLKQLEKKLPKNGEIATIIGRYYAMDRDNRWQREHKAYDALVNRKGVHYASWQKALHVAYKRGETDEFVQPSVIGCSVKKGDSIIFTNFRSDRARELTRAFVQNKFKQFKRTKIPDLYFACLTQYDDNIQAPVAFPPIKLKNTLGEVIAKKGIKQYRLAETEKWAHVTYFFNGLTGKIFSGEDRFLIPSPKVNTYDKSPAMSAQKITKQAEKILSSKKHDFILINYANPDMLGHTGKIKETKQSIEILDDCLGKLVKTAKKNNYAMIITSDHGNAEQLQYSDGKPCTAHTTNNVPCVFINTPKIKTHKNIALYDIAPTVLKIMGIKQPKEMTGKSLV